MDRPDEALAGKQVERIVQEAILQLEPTFRECLVLRDVEELSYEEIGAITGLPEGTVKSRIHRARAQLKELGSSAPWGREDHMSEPDETHEEERDDEAVKGLLKRALATGGRREGGAGSAQGVQRRIRKRSRGKFFSDGWSTGQAKVGYVLIALVTLVLVAVAYFGLGPMDVK